MTSLPAAGVAPTLGTRRHFQLSSFWFGFNFHWLPIAFVLLPSEVRSLVPHERVGSAIGLLVSAGAIFAVTVPPLVGAWSDRLKTRWGRRRPIVFAGTLLNLVGLALMMTAGSYLQLLIGYVWLQIFANAAGAAYSGIIPDVVPDEEFGKASGYLAAMNIVGGIAGVGVTFVTAGAGNVRLAFVLIGAATVVAMLLAVSAARGEGMGAIPQAPDLRPAERVRDFLAPLWSGDFGWVIFTRLMVTAGITVVSSFLDLFFKDVVHVANADQFTSLWLVVVFVFAVPFGFSGGIISDRFGRKRFVYASGAAQAVVALVFLAFYPTSTPLVLGLGGLYGLGYGLYYAVDWALACDCLPDRARSAKDMGLFHVAQTLPQTFAPAVGGFLLDAFNRHQPNSGYRAVFGSAIVFFALGTVFVSRIRRVR